MRSTLLIALAIASVHLACATTPAPTVTPTPIDPVSDYSIAQLVRWSNAGAEAIFRVPGVVGFGLDEEGRRITIDMEPRRGALDEMDAALSTLDAPRTPSQLTLDARAPLNGADTSPRLWKATSVTPSPLPWKQYPRCPSEPRCL